MQAWNFSINTTWEYATKRQSMKGSGEGCSESCVAFWRKGGDGEVDRSMLTYLAIDAIKAQVCSAALSVLPPGVL